MSSSSGRWGSPTSPATPTRPAPPAAGRRGATRTHGHLRRLLLVLPALHLAQGRDGAFVREGRRPLASRRPVRRRGGACHPPPPLLALRDQGALRPGLRRVRASRSRACSRRGWSATPPTSARTTAGSTPRRRRTAAAPSAGSQSRPSTSPCRSRRRTSSSPPRSSTATAQTPSACTPYSWDLPTATSSGLRRECTGRSDS